MTIMNRTYVRINVKARKREWSEFETDALHEVPCSARSRRDDAARRLWRLRRESTTTVTEIPGGADPEKVEVIVGWAKAESSGDNEAAAGYFAIPSIAQNGVTVQIDRPRPTRSGSAPRCHAARFSRRPSRRAST